MKHLAAPLLLTLLPALASAQDDPDIEVYRPVSTVAPIPAGVVAFDADWTADSKVAMTYVEDHGTAHKLIIGIYDPSVSGPAAFVKLGELMAAPWRMTDVSLAVPVHSYGDSKRDRIYVAASVQAEVQGTWTPYGTEVVNGVRLLSVPMDGSATQLSMAVVKNVPGMQSHSLVETPHAQVTVLPLPKNYLVEMAFIDPNSQLYGNNPVNGKDSQVLVTRSRDFGTSLEDAFYATGVSASNAAALQSSMGHSQFGRLGLAADESFGGTVLAVEDVNNDVVHVLTSNPGIKRMDWYGSTPSGDYRPEFAPRIASEEARFNVTCLAGSKTAKKGNQLVWFSGVLNGAPALTEHVPLHDRAATEADIDVRGMKAWIVARCYPDNGSLPVPTVFEDQRNDPIRMLTAVEIADNGDAAGTPRSLVSPDGTPKRGSYFFGREGGASLPEGVWMDP